MFATAGGLLGAAAAGGAGHRQGALASMTGTSYEDSGAAKGTTHFYRVTAPYADGTESAPGADRAALAP
ncbi:hypothetical protein [Streptomyces sp. NPDC051636]|uniref:hypothetical protein n=1 Tax=Streptomyces sp. NPDC051636 TaxID=3365663 RepID=UPI003789EEDE